MTTSTLVPVSFFRQLSLPLLPQLFDLSSDLAKAIQAIPELPPSLSIIFMLGFILIVSMIASPLQLIWSFMLTPIALLVFAFLRIHKQKRKAPVQKHHSDKNTPSMKRPVPVVNQIAVADQIPVTDQASTQSKDAIQVNMTEEEFAQIQDARVTLFLTNHNLTRRELEIALLIAQGMSTKDIAQALFVEQSTVRHHYRQVFKKVKVSSSDEFQNLIANL